MTACATVEVRPELDAEADCMSRMLLLSLEGEIVVLGRPGAERRRKPHRYLNRSACKCDVCMGECEEVKVQLRPVMFP